MSSDGSRFGVWLIVAGGVEDEVADEFARSMIQRL
jgi:hypothetical protein